MSGDLTKPTLPTFSWIGHLKEDDRELLSSYGEFFPGHPDNVIIEEGHVQTEVFVVISGELEVHKEKPDGTRVLLARVGPGETLGEISLFAPGPATATVIATEFSQLWRIADDDLIQFMQDNPGAGNVLLRTLATILAQRLRQMDPEAFGLSAYAVVESPELKVHDASLPPVEAPAPSPEPPAIPADAPVSPTSPSAAAPLRPIRTTPPPISEPGAGAAVKPLSDTQSLPDPDELEPL
jgi:CRP/FNR family transcriptional regulator, cyclic AMP receptor protein